MIMNYYVCVAHSGWQVSVPEVCPDGANECTSVIQLRCEPKTCNPVQPTIDKWSVNRKGGCLVVLKNFIYSHFLDNWHYANKGKDKSAEPYDQRCSFPFIIKGEEHNTCSEEQCALLTDDKNNAVLGMKGFCDPSDDPHGG